MLFSKIREIVIKHIKSHFNSYFFLLLAFIIGVSAGAFTVNGLSAIQKDELTNYFQGFIQLLDNQKIDSGELLKISLMDNIKLVLILWILGVTIIGIPFIFIIVGIRGFITGFCSGFVIETLGLKGIAFTVLSLLPKEFIIIPCIIALGVNGINFSLSIIKKKSNKQKHVQKENIKTSFLSYCGFTFIAAAVIFTGILLDAYVTPVFVRILSNTIIN